jgi:hypothetical protein
MVKKVSSPKSGKDIPKKKPLTAKQSKWRSIALQEIFGKTSPSSGVNGFLHSLLNQELFDDKCTLEGGFVRQVQLTNIFLKKVSEKSTSFPVNVYGKAVDYIDGRSKYLQEKDYDFGLEDVSKQMMPITLPVAIREVNQLMNEGGKPVMYLSSATTKYPKPLPGKVGSRGSHQMAGILFKTLKKKKKRLIIFNPNVEGLATKTLPTIFSKSLKSGNKTSAIGGPNFGTAILRYGNQLKTEDCFQRTLKFVADVLDGKISLEEYLSMDED